MSKSALLKTTNNDRSINAYRHLLPGEGEKTSVFSLQATGMGSSWDITVSSGLFYKALMEEIPCCYTGIFNAGLSISPFTLCLYLIMLCEFWIFPPALKWNVNY